MGLSRFFCDSGLNFRHLVESRTYVMIWKFSSEAKRKCFVRSSVNVPVKISSSFIHILRSNINIMVHCDFKNTPH